jgi:hypothetical protein
MYGHEMWWAKAFEKKMPFRKDHIATGCKICGKLRAFIFHFDD